MPLLGEYIYLASAILGAFVIEGLRQEVLSPKSSLYFLYPLTVVPLTVYAYHRHHRSRRRHLSLGGFLRFLFPLRIFLHRSSRLDCEFFLVNLIVKGSLAVVVVSGLKVVSPWTTRALTSLLGPPAPGPAHVPVLVVVLFAAFSFCVPELAYYFVHRAFHRVPWLWEFHKVHHSPEVLTPIAAARTNSVDFLCVMSVFIIFTDLTAGVFNFFYPGVVEQSLLLGVNGLVIVSNALGGYLTHSGVWLHYGRRLNHVIITPAHHQIHHSTAKEHLGKNLGFYLSLWDWIFGTLYVPGEREELQFGLGNGEEENYRSVAQLYFTPFVKLWTHHLKPILRTVRE